MHEIRILIDDTLSPSEGELRAFERVYGTTTFCAAEEDGSVAVTFSVEPHVDVPELLRAIGERFATI